MSILKFPVTKGQRQFLTGLGLNVSIVKCPIADLQACNVKWVRIDATQNPTTAQIDTMIQWYGVTGGFLLDWIVGVTPIASGAYADNSAVAKLIISRYAVNGYKPVPILELGNEVIQQHISDFGTEAAARTAYASLLTTFMSELSGLGACVSAINDEPPFLKRFVDSLAVGAVMPDVFSCHGYSVSTSGQPGTNGPGTNDMMSQVCNTDIYQTEGNYTANTVALADAVTYFNTMVANMGTRPWCYYTALDIFYNTTTDAFAWYNTQSAPDSSGVTSASGRTTTLNNIASANGFKLA